MNRDDAIEAALRGRPADERIYDEPLADLNAAGVRRVRVGSSAPLRSAAFLVACLGLIIAAAVIYPLVADPRVTGPTIAGPTASHSATAPRFEASPRTTTADQVPDPTFLQYVVVRGDSLSSIASKLNVQLWEIELANPQITNPNRIQVGWVLNVPPPGLLTPVPGVTPAL